MLISTSPSKCREMYTHNFEFVGMDSCRQRDLITCHLFCGLIWGIVSFWMYTIIISIEWHSELMWCWDAGWGDAALLWCSDAVWAGNRRLWGGGLLIAQCFCCWSHGREHTHELNITLSLSLSLSLSLTLLLWTDSQWHFPTAAKGLDRLHAVSVSFSSWIYIMNR